MRTQRGIEMMHHGQVLGVVQAFVIADDPFRAQNLLGVLHALFGQMHLFLLLVDEIVARNGRLVLLAFLGLARQLRHDAVDAHVQLRRIVRRPGDDERRSRFVDQDRVDLVDDGVVEAALVALLLGQRHVVAQIVETEFVVRAVGDVGRVRGALVRVFHPRIDDPDLHAEEAVDLAHPGGVAPGQIVVHGDDVHTLARQGVEVHRQGRDQGLALARAHLGYLAGMQHHAADQLHVVVAQFQDAAAGFAHHREGFRQERFEFGAVGEALAELGGLGLQGGVRQVLQPRLEGVDLRHGLVHLAQQTLVAAAEDARQDAIEHVSGNAGSGSRYGPLSRPPKREAAE
jgi:hypothetical protein